MDITESDIVRDLGGGAAKTAKKTNVAKRNWVGTSWSVGAASYHRHRVVVGCAEADVGLFTRTTPWVSVDELRRVLGESKAHGKEERVVLVDTRGAEAYDKGHLDGAVRMGVLHPPGHLRPGRPRLARGHLPRPLRPPRRYHRRRQRAGRHLRGGPHVGLRPVVWGYFLLKWLGHPNVSHPPPAKNELCADSSHSRRVSFFFRSRCCRVDSRRGATREASSHSRLRKSRPRSSR